MINNSINQVTPAILPPSVNQNSFANKVTASIDGSTVFVSSSVYIENTLVYNVLRYVKDKSSKYVLRDVIVPPITLGRYNYFAMDMALSSDKSTLVVGASCTSTYPTNDADPGYIFVYRLNDLGDYVIKDTLMSDIPHRCNIPYFGTSLSVSYDGSVIATRDLTRIHEDDTIYATSVSVFIRDKKTYKKKWTFRDEESESSNFGNEIVMSAYGITIAVASQDNVFIYDYDIVSRDYKLTIKLSDIRRNVDLENPSIDINVIGNMLVVSSNGTIHIYTKKDGKWFYKNNIKIDIGDSNIKLSSEESNIIVTPKVLVKGDEESIILQTFNRVDKISNIWTNKHNVRCMIDEITVIDKPIVLSGENKVLIGTTISHTEDDVFKPIGLVQSITFN